MRTPVLSALHPALGGLTLCGPGAYYLLRSPLSETECLRLSPRAQLSIRELTAPRRYTSLRLLLGDL